MPLVQAVSVRDFCATMSKKRLIISTDELNRYKYRVLSSGGRFDDYLKNPVLLFGHDWNSAPIGRLEDIKVEENSISAIPVFDENDAFGLACKIKWENNFLFAASIGFDPISTSSDPEYILPGQIGETVTEWNLLEVSMVTVPANKGAAAGIGLGYNDFRSSMEIFPITTKTIKMDKIAKVLGLNPEGVTDDIVVLAIEKIKNEISSLSAARIDALIEQGKVAGKVDVTNETAWRTLAATNYESTALLLKATSVIPDTPVTQEQAKPQPPQTIVGMLSAAGGGDGNGQNTQQSNRDSWSFDDWSKNDSKGLAAMKKTDAAKYQSLAQAKYNSVV